jgi:hypothetical protein
MLFRFGIHQGQLFWLFWSGALLELILVLYVLFLIRHFHKVKPSAELAIESLRGNRAGNELDTVEFQPPHTPGNWACLVHYCDLKADVGIPLNINSPTLVSK